MRTQVEILADPQSQVYRSLVIFAESRCDTFSLVWRQQLKFSAAAETIALSLQSLLVREENTDEWPGTKLLGHKATVRYYKMHGNATEVLFRANSLYSWLAPNLPEDLAFYEQSRCWFASISHEQMAWFEDECLTVEQVRAAIAGVLVKSVVRP